MTDFHLGPTPAPATGVLAGRGVLITRPMWQAVTLAQKLDELGAVPFIFPAIVIAKNEALDLSAAQARLQQCQRAFFVSANAAREGLMGLKQFPAQVKVYAPGPGTAETLAACGVATVCTPTSSFDTQGLLALPELQSLKQERVMIFTGVNGKGDLAAALQARGATVETVACYHRLKPQTSAMGLNEAWAQGRIAASVLTSAEGIDNFWHCLDTQGRSALIATPAFVPHANVAAAARAKGIAQVMVTEPGDAALLAALHQYFH
jgi:uroporphyrinogen-III synthase